ncbi:hypothetical protein R69746_04424 [Paraburkholderia aspalathi]|uniref:retron Ec48 family effector membrane protein n=1 Tax=Paraburkholderia aspalathi TaxID=1324617 RepID=UPI00190BE951|nr:retron Ec48 family effector membrane protein [Paraburkholderia aspalathi]MBK3840494.1 hypothetical protein [Paraburkholderia aspalathi]CAE6784055.1 hypothetical protein R69746_04424 [Paraburkholderia aspalathi]
MNNMSPRSVVVLLVVLLLVAASGYLLSLASIVSTALHDHLFSKSFCLREDCIEYWTKANDYSLSVAKATSDFVVALATAGGIVVALMTYVSNVSNSALANHINHYAIFQTYVINEVAKRDRVTPSSVDIFLWYNTIFMESRVGLMRVSDKYKKFTGELNDRIALSNDKAKHATDGSYRYTEHQARIKEKLIEIGISISAQPRNDFYEIEDQVFSLIGAVNQSFCFSSEIPRLHTRIYV